MTTSLGRKKISTRRVGDWQVRYLTLHPHLSRRRFLHHPCDTGCELKSGRVSQAEDCVDGKGRTLDFNPSLQIASQSSLDCSEAAGLVSSIYRRCQYSVHCLAPLLLLLCMSLTHIISAKIVQSLRNLNLFLGVKEGICKLFAFSESTLDDLKT